MSSLSSISEVCPTSSLYLSAGTAVSESALRQRGVTLVVNAAKELPVFPMGDGVRVVKVSVEDSPQTDLHRHFEEVSDIIASNCASGGATLVHCVAGVSRSASLCLAYLMRHRRLTLAEAYAQVKRARPVVRPNTGFLAQLARWEEECADGDGGRRSEEEEAGEIVVRTL